MTVYGHPAKQKQLKDGFARAGKKLDMGKACIRFRTLDDLPLDTIADIIASTPSTPTSPRTNRAGKIVDSCDLDVVIEISRAAWYVGLAYTIWGFFPIYWKALAGISPLQLICHRIVWSFLMLAVMIARSQEFRAMWQAAQSPRIVIIYAVAGVAIAANWLLYVWAVGVNEIVQISLGYFINPLLSVVLGMVVFHERLRRLQWVSVALAAAGVVYLTVALDSVPWIALVLAASFGTYGLMKKLAPLGPVQGLTFETGHPVRSRGGLSDFRGARRARRLHARRAAAERA